MKEKLIKKIEKYYFPTFSQDEENEIIEVDGKLLSIVEYDEKGNIILSKTYDNEDEVAEHIERKYDENRLIEELIFVDGDVVEKHEFNYNSENLIENEKVTYSDDTVESWIYKYDINKNLIEKRTQYPDSEENSYQIFEYKDNKLVSEKEFENGELYFEKLFEYDENNNLTAFILKDFVENKEEKIIYEYDNNQNKIRELKYDFQGRLVTRLSFRYNENNQLIKKIEDTTYSSRSYIFEYNELGKLSSQIQVDENEEELTKINFLYDGDILVENKSVGKNDTDCFIVKNEVEFYS
jgi:antitoxin component YwqK of YwqJK toxin-antitoxin module